MSSPTLIVVGASAGGVEALTRLVAALPADLPAAVLAVLHVAPGAPSVLPHILARSATIAVRPARDGDPIRDGIVYVAPPDHHLVVEGDRLALVRGPRENGHRPALDPLFRSAARAYGAGVLGVVLSGTLSDGTHGLAQVKANGGIALVQSPEEALHPSMPESAIAHVAVDHVLPIEALAAMLVRLARARAAEPTSLAPLPPRRPEGAPRRVLDEVRVDEPDAAASGPALNEALGGQVSPFTCPECHGTLWEIRDGLPVRFRCRVGHSYDEPAFLLEKGDALEAALWTALTALEESASFTRRMAERATVNGRPHAAELFCARVLALEERADVIRRVIGTLPDGAVALPTGETP